MTCPPVFVFASHAATAASTSFEYFFANIVLRRAEGFVNTSRAYLAWRLTIPLIAQFSWD
jgi:hypothetical protein